MTKQPEERRQRHDRRERRDRRQGQDRRQGRLPSWLYEALPYAYIVAGITSAVALGNAGAYLSGLMLVSAGAVIIKLRRDFRARRPVRTMRSEELGEVGGARRREVTQLIWRAEFATGHELIDRQHRRLFSIGNELVASLLAGSSAADIELLLDDLVNDVSEHFATEESVLAELGRPLDDAHRTHHRALLERVRDYRDNCHAGQLRINELVKFIADDVIAGHIVAEDLRLGTHDPLRPTPDFAAQAAPQPAG